MKANHLAPLDYKTIPIVGSTLRCIPFNALRPLKWTLDLETTSFVSSLVNESYMSIYYSLKNFIGLHSRTTMCFISPWVSRPSSVKSKRALKKSFGTTCIGQAIISLDQVTHLSCHVIHRMTAMSFRYFANGKLCLVWGYKST